MNEEQKNIETCLPEDILDEVANVPTDPQFRSLTDEALDPLKQQAAAQAGYDGYKEVVMYHQPYTFTSAVAQMKSNLILLLRRLWRFPFGRGTIRSLADMWQHYITRLKGNPEYGIPSRLSSLTDLPSAPALLADRDVSSGIRFGTNPQPDGLSLAQLLCSGVADKVTEIVDNNTGWVMTKPLLNIFPNASKVIIAAKRIEFAEEGTNVINSEAVKDVEILNAEYVKGSFRSIASDAKVNAPKMTSCFVGYGGGPNCEEVLMPSLREPNGIHIFRWWQTDSPLVMKHMVIGSLRSGGIRNWSNGKADDLLDFEVGADGLGGVSMNFDISWWTAANCIDTSEHLKQFLYNFKHHIAERLTDKGKGLTLTLSQEVRNAIHAAEGEYGIENIIITKKGWTISPAPN